MSFVDFSPETLRELLSLSEKKEDLLTQIVELDSKIEAAVAGRSVSPSASKPAKAVKAPKIEKIEKIKTTRQARGSVKEAILEALKDKPEGLSVPELAKITGSKIPSLHTFFATTGKKIEGLKKIARGVWAYSLDSASTPAPQPATIEPPVAEAASDAAAPAPAMESAPAPIPAAESQSIVAEIPAPSTQLELAAQH